MKKNKKIIILALIVSMFLGSFSSALAYSKSYTFNIRYSVTGSADYSLGAKSTSTKAKGQTYTPSEKVSDDKSSFTVFLQKGLKSYSVGPITANNKNATKSFGKVKKGSYRVNVNKYSSTGDRIKGSGTINQ